MKTSKILIIDSDIIFRRAVIRILRENRDCQVVSSDDIRNAADLVARLEPDLVLLSVRWSKVEELALITVLRSRFPDLPLVILTEPNEEGAVVAISGFQVGAVDFIVKPASANSLLFSDTHLSKRLIPVVSASLRMHPLRSVNEPSGQKSLFKNPEQKVLEVRESNRRARMICVGGCSGGLAALFNLIPNLPGDFPVPILVAQYIPEIYTKVLAEKLDILSDLNVKEAKEGELMEAGTAYVIPGGYHGKVERYGDRTFLKLYRGSQRHNYRPSIDLTFKSVAYTFGRNSLGVVLSGYEQDGVAGAGIIQGAGGQILVESPRSSLFYELPMAVLRKGYGNACYPINEMARQLISRVSRESFEKNEYGAFNVSRFQPSYLKKTGQIVN